MNDLACLFSLVYRVKWSRSSIVGQRSESGRLIWQVCRYYFLTNSKILINYFLFQGFAVNLNYLSKYPNATMPYKAGYEEDAFLRSIDLKIEDIEPKANDCTEVYVWHTQTTKTKAPTIRISRDTLETTHTNLNALMKLLQEMGVSHTSSSGGKIERLFIYFVFNINFHFSQV
jgi:Glycosyltransferase family 43